MRTEIPGPTIWEDETNPPAWAEKQRDWMAAQRETNWTLDPQSAFNWRGGREYNGHSPSL